MPSSSSRSSGGFGRSTSSSSYGRSSSSGGFGRSSSSSSYGSSSSSSNSYGSNSYGSSSYNKSNSEQKSSPNTKSSNNKESEKNIHIPPPTSTTSSSSIQTPYVPPYVPQQTVQPQSGGFFNTMLNGYFWGMGSSMGRRAVEGVTGDRTSTNTNTNPKPIPNTTITTQDSTFTPTENLNIPHLNFESSLNESKQIIPTHPIPKQCENLYNDYLNCVEFTNKDHCIQFNDDYLNCVNKIKSENK